MIKIREMRSSDIDAMLRIRLDWLANQYDESETTELERAWFARYPGNEMAPALVAEDDGQIIAYALCSLTTHPTAVGRAGEIDEVCVLEAYRRQGIGARLVAEARRLLRSRVDDLTAIQARVARDDGPAAAFLRAQGFEHDVLEFSDYLD